MASVNGMQLRSNANLLRVRGEVSDSKVTFVELFFDLVFVFAITQLSHVLLEHFTPTGILKTAILFLAVWRVWIATTWVTNWVNPEEAPVQLMLFALMLAGLVMSMSIPTAYEAGGLGFALAHSFMQVGRSLFMLWALAGRSPEKHGLFHNMTWWLSLAAVLWIAGALVEGEWRVLLWAIALAIEYAAPAAGFWTPHRGRAPTTKWDVSGAHMAERCGLFVIICLGESILLTGANFAQMSWTVLTMSAFVAAFVGTVALWWVYFHIGHERASHLIDRCRDPGRVARLWFTYIHIPIVAGIMLTAASDKLLLADPAGRASTAAAVALLGGPALFLLGALWLKRACSGGTNWPHLAGLALLGVAALFATSLSALSLGAIASAILVLVAVWERRVWSPGAELPSLDFD